MSTVRPSDQTGAIGVTLCQLVIERDFGWIFRRLDHRDVGIDAELEVVWRGRSTGLLLAAQIKTGLSYFSESTPGGWKYRGDYQHLQYWDDHSLSVVVILVNPDTERIYFAPVRKRDVHRAEKSWTIDIREDSRLSARAFPELLSLAWAQDPGDALFKYCQLHAEYIRCIRGGGKVSVDVTDWVNKTRGQVQMKIIVEPEDGPPQETDAFFLAGAGSDPDFVAKVFPWSDVELDEYFYDMNEDEPPPEAVFQDSDEPGGYYVVPGERPSGLRPYGCGGGGEVEFYRYVLSLNATGLAYAKLVDEGSRVDTPSYLTARALRPEEAVEPTDE